MKETSNIEPSDLTRSGTRGFSWNLAGNIVRSITTFSVNVLLARLLGPEPFGLVALALIVISIGNLVVSAGFSSGLVQKKELEPGDIAFVFTVQMTLGVGFAALVAIAAPFLATALSNPQVTPVLRVMAVMLVTESFVQVPTSLLRRRIDFKRFQQIQIGSYLIGYLGLGVPMALAGFGVWSLVAAVVGQSFLNSVFAYLAVRPTLAITGKVQEELKQFGLRILGANIANWIIQNVDNLTVGRAFGSTSLGFYSRAFNLSVTMVNVVVGAAQSVLFSVVSRVEEKTRPARVFVMLFTAFAILFFPAFSILAVGARDIILIIYGPAWEMTAHLLVPLAVAMPLYALTGLESPVLNGLGKPGYGLRIQWLTVLFAIIVLTAASGISLELTAWTIPVIYALRLVLMTGAISNVLALNWRQVMRPIALGILLAGLVGGSWELCARLLPSAWLLWTRVGIQSIVAGSCWIIFVMVGKRWFIPDWKMIIKMFLRERSV